MELQRLMGVGPVKAEKIIQARRDHELTPVKLAEVTGISEIQWKEWIHDGVVSLTKDSYPPDEPIPPAKPANQSAEPHKMPSPSEAGEESSQSGASLPDIDVPPCLGPLSLHPPQEMGSAQEKISVPSDAEVGKNPLSPGQKKEVTMDSLHASRMMSTLQTCEPPSPSLFLRHGHDRHAFEDDAVSPGPQDTDSIGSYNDELAYQAYVSYRNVKSTLEETKENQDKLNRQLARQDKGQLQLSQQQKYQWEHAMHLASQQKLERQRLEDLVVNVWTEQKRERERDRKQFQEQMSMIASQMSELNARVSARSSRRSSRGSSSSSTSASESKRSTPHRLQRASDKLKAFNELHDTVTPDVPITEGTLPSTPTQVDRLISYSPASEAASVPFADSPRDVLQKSTNKLHSYETNVSADVIRQREFGAILNRIPEDGVYDPFHGDSRNLHPGVMVGDRLLHHSAFAKTQTANQPDETGLSVDGRVLPSDGESRPRLLRTSQSGMELQEGLPDADIYDQRPTISSTVTADVPGNINVSFVGNQLPAQQTLVAGMTPLPSPGIGQQASVNQFHPSVDQSKNQQGEEKVTVFPARPRRFRRSMAAGDVREFEYSEESQCPVKSIQENLPQRCSPANKFPVDRTNQQLPGPYAATRPRKTAEESKSTPKSVIQHRNAEVRDSSYRHNPQTVRKQNSNQMFRQQTQPYGDDNMYREETGYSMYQASATPGRSDLSWDHMGLQGVSAAKRNTLERQVLQPSVRGDGLVPTHVREYDGFTPAQVRKSGGLTPAQCRVHDGSTPVHVRKSDGLTPARAWKNDGFTIPTQVKKTEIPASAQVAKSAKRGISFKPSVKQEQWTPRQTRGLQKTVRQTGVINIQQKCGSPAPATYDADVDPWPDDDVEDDPDCQSTEMDMPEDNSTHWYQDPEDDRWYDEVPMHPAPQPRPHPPSQPGPQQASQPRLHSASQPRLHPASQQGPHPASQRLQPESQQRLQLGYQQRPHSYQQRPQSRSQQRLPPVSYARNAHVPRQDPLPVESPQNDYNLMDEPLLPEHHEDVLYQEQQDVGHPRQRPAFNGNQRRYSPTVKLPQFNGTIGKWERFEFQFRNFARMYGWDNQERLDHLTSCLTDNAIDYVSSLPHQILNNYDLMMDNLKRRFRGTERPEIIRKDIQDMKQRVDESLEDFADRIQKAALLAFQGADPQFSDLLGAEYFIRGVKDRNAAYETVKANPQTVQEALTLMKNTAALMKSVYGRSHSHLRQVTFVDDPPHILQASTSVKSFTPRSPGRSIGIQWSPPQTPTRFKNQASSPGSPRSPRRRSRPLHNLCFHCNEPGHFKADCPRLKNSPKGSGQQ
jgi:hypothetical protein